jgi:hypothetical protein
MSDLSTLSSKLLSNQGVDLEQLHALLDTKEIIDQRGDSINVKVRGEDNVIRDRYNTIKKLSDVTSLAFNAYPIDFNPNKYRIEKAGLFEESELLLYTATADWFNAGYTFDTINIKRTTIYVRDQMYVIKEKGLASQFGDVWLYITFGLYKE